MSIFLFLFLFFLVSLSLLLVVTATSSGGRAGIDGGAAQLGETAEKDRARRRSSVVAPVSGPASASISLATRPLISHGRTHSAASTLRSNASSESSHEPPSTPNDTARISISSTLYQDSHYSIPFDPPYSAPLPLPLPLPHVLQQHQQNTMHSPASDRESFIDLASPRTPEFYTRNFRVNSPATSDRYSYRKDLSNLADLSLQPSPPIINAITVKPPLPTSPKPSFSKRSHSVQPPQPRNRPQSPDRQNAGIPTLLPSTTNLLDPKERADRVRQNRKLAQMFGQTPASIEAMTAAHDVDGVPSSLLCAPGNYSNNNSNVMMSGKRKPQHLRGAVSMSVNTSGTREHLPTVAWPPPDGTKHLTLSARRHSSPLTPDVMTFLDGPAHYGDDDGDDDDRLSSHPSGVIVIGSHVDDTDDVFRKPVRHKRSSSALTSPTSFIDLSEEDLAGDGVSSVINLETPTMSTRRPPSAMSPSSASIYSFTSDDLAEEDRRRKREKLAKLHRFLGSRVPANVILGQLSIDTALELPPPATSTVSAVDRPKQMDPDARKTWVRRRRSSSAAEFSGRWSDEIDRLKEELNDKEKAQNVKRAVKMEKMFGIAPPQTLYHTRAAPSSAGGVHASLSNPPSSSSNNNNKPHRSSSYSPVSPQDYMFKNLNQSAYTRNKAKRKSNRPGTAESSEPLMNGFGEDSHPKFGFSEVYEHYRHSLNSLNDIIDRDDKASLERLHDLIHGDSYDHEPQLQTFTRQDDPVDEPPTPKAERRRSLPARASVTSLASEFSIAASIASPDPEETMFQTRRRRAAKLTQFFGVDYRELMSEILESLEKGLEEEGGRGTLKPDEVQELLVKLRKLKTKRSNFLG
ncbi:hypothetical protein BDY19DRAFT_23212 [Irpex rosettiformis]|uniref:Uncharacterized protein n=1 Tax=Irpex rosettiformis TaxID=378272 RepID=A0ACB8UJP3_9APHY|nr:hypothetical protein BDY19DRAFT_23212 [Irpex rosettiformis]